MSPSWDLSSLESLSLLLVPESLEEELLDDEELLDELELDDEELSILSDVSKPIIGRRLPIFSPSPTTGLFETRGVLISSCEVVETDLSGTPLSKVFDLLSELGENSSGTLEINSLSVLLRVRH